MRADAARVFFAGDLQGLTVVVLANAGGAKRLGFLPLELGQVDDRAVDQDNLRFDPIGPIAGISVDFGDQQVKFLGAVELCIELDEPLFVLGEQEGRFGDRLRVGGGSQGDQAK